MIMDQPLLQVQHLSKSFGGVHALKDVQFALRHAEIHALLGENGAGKSTLIKIITGLYQPDQGDILLDGQPIRFANTHAAKAQGIVAIYQEPSLFPDLDIAENIFVGRQPMRAGRIDWQRMYAEAAELLGRLGVSLNPRTKARALSVAQMQLVEIARALSIKTRVLIMDEPTSALTLSEIEDLFVIVRQLREQGTSIIFISHHLEELFALCDRVTVLRDGSYVNTTSMSDVSTDSLIQMMVGRTLQEMFPKQKASIGDVVLDVEGLGVAGKFRDVAFKLHKGEILGMAGLIGAGRTELACALFGTDPATSGTIRLDGKIVRISSPQQAMQLGISYVPEDRKLHGLVLPMSIANNITLPELSNFTRFGWLNSGQEREMARQASQGLAVKMSSVDQIAGQLSGGNQQKVVLAKWLGTQPQVLILDEPTRGIDVGTKAAVHALMSNLAAQGMAILMISSELPEVLGMSDRILVMREGRVAAEFSRAEATQEKLMAAATGV